MNRIIFFSGAGLSAESGIPTFRDQNGLWEKYDVNEVANINNFYRNKEMCLNFYNERRAQMGSKKPNAAHIVIAELQKKYGINKVLNFTQNIDDLLEKAGCVDVVHVHGKLQEAMCRNSSCAHTWEIEKDLDMSTTCPNCGTNDIKPNVVLFNENAPEYLKLYTTIPQASKDDLVIVVGTNGEVINAYNLFGFSDCLRILITLDYNEELMNPTMFNRFYKNKCGEVLPKIKHNLEKWLITGEFEFKV